MTEHIDLDDALNGDWLANLRKMKGMTKAQKRRFIKKMERIGMVTVNQKKLEKALGRQS